MERLVSIIIPVYNADSVLKGCLTSIFQSNYKNLEVIVVDDASTDNSVFIAKQFPCKLIQQNTNTGPATARNLGAKEAKGEILFFVDADTEMFPETVNEVVRTLSKSGIDAVVGIYAKHPLNKGFFPEYYALLKHFSHTCKDIQRYNVFSAHCAAIKKEIFLSVEGFKDFKWGVDIENEELGRRIAAKYNIIINPRLQVKHYFGSFKKLIYIFNNRTFWWVKFFLRHKRFEQALTTKSFGLGTIAVLITFIFLLGGIFFRNIKFLWIIAILAFLTFLFAYLRFVIFTIKEKGLIFGFSSLLASLFFSFIISYAAIRSLLSCVLSLKDKNPLNVFKRIN